MIKEKFGEIIVSAHNDMTLSPISDVQVEIADMKGNLIKTLQTNKFGNTEKVILPALSKQNRLSDEFTEEQTSKANGKYVITIKHPNYQPVRMVGIQIFENSKALPEVKLSALRNDNGFTIKTLIMEDTKTPILKIIQNPYNFSDFSLNPASFLPSSHHSHHSYSLTSFTPPPIGLVIPEFVHLQLFSNNGTSRRLVVPFVDYIKGVAHIEIQGFIEDEAIKACVIAIISFTLNRIYTEFYRRQNKDYDITNNGIDQDYVENYTPQEPLIRNIEEVFNEYVEYPGAHSFPFLSQYCNGTTVKCASQGLLEQTPSREMAKNKKGYRDILKHYYGQNINTISATSIIVKNQIRSFIVPMKLGNSGSDVLLQQQYLEVIGKDYKIPAFTKAIDENGEFGKKTEEAVKLFQRQVMKLSKEKANGIIDQKTWYVILTRYLVIVEHGNERNYHPLDHPPQSIPSKKLKFKDVLDFFPYLASWIYIWTKESKGKEGFWFWPAYIGVNHFQGYIWKNNEADSFEVYALDIYAVGDPSRYECLNNMYNDQYRINSYQGGQFQNLVGHFFIVKKGIKRLQIQPNTGLFIYQSLFDSRSGEENLIILYPIINKFGGCINVSAKVTLNELLGM
ncbi:peptidoglycan-binding domain-containing protein [Priestia aryabhattai]|uniref:peptidoglycan-binding domain-containing protein n=1 Tax=Priestia aryabhattai TaxID=412384 RepID=UPI001C8D476D|nr:peptidoglycan-binding domain-containing protein [Priestia aryabhattai]MBX9985526.1 peptidoglycan-binding protein [Priestia aryabhattai]